MESAELQAEVLDECPHLLRLAVVAEGSCERRRGHFGGELEVAVEVASVYPVRFIENAFPPQLLAVHICSLFPQLPGLCAPGPPYCRVCVIAIERWGSCDCFHEDDCDADESSNSSETCNKGDTQN